MTESLHNKFTALEALLAQQNAAIAALIAVTNDRLNTIATGISALSDITTILSNIHLDTQSMDLKLLRIRDAIWPADDPEISDTRASLKWSLYRLMDATAPAWPRPTSMPLQPALDYLMAELEASLGINSLGTDYSVLALLLHLKDNLGIPTGDATTTVLGRLAAIQRQQLLCCFSSDPAVADPTGCTSPVSSVQPALADTAAPGRLFASWPDLSSYDVSFTTTFGLTATNVEISPAVNWTGFSLFVGSKSATTFSKSPSTNGSWPTNRWLSLASDGAYPLAISVAEGQDITAYLCVPGATDCTMLLNETHISGWQSPDYDITGKTSIRLDCAGGGNGSVELYVDGSLKLSVHPLPHGYEQVWVGTGSTAYVKNMLNASAFMQLQACTGMIAPPNIPDACDELINGVQSSSYSSGTIDIRGYTHFSLGGAGNGDGTVTLEIDGVTRITLVPIPAGDTQVWSGTGNNAVVNVSSTATVFVLFTACTYTPA
jgi:hypothetical protein